MLATYQRYQFTQRTPEAYAKALLLTGFKPRLSFFAGNNFVMEADRSRQRRIWPDTAIPGRNHAADVCM